MEFRFSFFFLKEDSRIVKLQNRTMRNANTAVDANKRTREDCDLDRGCMRKRRDVTPSEATARGQIGTVVTPRDAPLDDAPPEQADKDETDTAPTPRDAPLDDAPKGVAQQRGTRSVSEMVEHLIDAFQIERDFGDEAIQTCRNEIFAVCDRGGGVERYEFCRGSCRFMLGSLKGGRSFCPELGTTLCCVCAQMRSYLYGCGRSIANHFTSPLVRIR